MAEEEDKSLDYWERGMIRHQQRTWQSQLGEMVVAFPIFLGGTMMVAGFYAPVFGRKGFNIDLMVKGYGVILVGTCVTSGIANLVYEHCETPLSAYSETPNSREA